MKMISKKLLYEYFSYKILKDEDDEVTFEVIEEIMDTINVKMDEMFPFEMLKERAVLLLTEGAA